MVQNEASAEEETSKQVELPWINFLSKPQMNFRRPKVPLPHKAPHQYIVAILAFFSLFSSDLFSLIKSASSVEKSLLFHSG